VDRVHGIGVRVHGTSLNMSHSFGDLQLGLNEPKGYPELLILVVNAGMDGLRLLDRHGRHNRGARARPAPTACRSRPLPTLWSTKHNEVFTYGIGATWGTRLANLDLAAGDGGC
jgi:hypothetical protein